MGLGPSVIPSIADALEDLASGRAPVLWLQGLSCSGCSVSLLNAESPALVEMLTSYFSLWFHTVLSTATGEIAMEVMNRTIERGDYYLVIEGSIPEGMPLACQVGEEPISDQVLRAARQAKAVISVGTCAAFGGIPAAEHNLTGAVSVTQFLEHKNVRCPLLNVPGCPAHPDWIVGTLIHLMQFGMPQVDSLNRPSMFYSRLVHDQCPRFSDYERERFARTFSEEGCLFKLGCLGPTTYADCGLRFWNGDSNYCIKAGAPCIGCASNDFAANASFPFYTKPSAVEEKI